MRDRWAVILLAVSMVVYLGSRFYRIEDFPIYFFCDEAVHSVRFKQLIENNWHGTESPQEFLPAYFENGGMFNLSLSVYVQGLVSLIAGQTVTVVRATSAVISLTGGVALALTLRRVFAVREWWSVIAVLAVLPCWFLHSRTGFETVMMVSAYCWFIYFYLRYREESPRWIFAAMASGAATFYAYAPGQGVMAVTGVLLLGCDFRYHWAHRRTVGSGLLWGLVLFAPYLRFRVQHPAMMREHLRTLGSYWTEPISLNEKLLTFVRNYLEGLSPRFWFEAGADPAIRHVVPYRAHFPSWLAPLALIGFARCLQRWREAPYRLVLIAIVAAPFSSAMVAPMVTRMLACVVPFALLTVLGFDWLLARLRWPRVHAITRVLACGALTFATAGLVRGALDQGLSYSKNFGLYGTQWGAPELFRDLIPRYLRANPGANVFISHYSFNSPHVFPDFFGWMNRRRVMFAVLDEYIAGHFLPEPKDFVVFTAKEYDESQHRFEVDRFVVRERIDLPNGQPGFYLGHLYLNEIFADKMRREAAHSLRPNWERIIVGNQGVSVTATGVSEGRLATLFSDGGGKIVSRPGEAINVTIRFDEPIELKQIQVEAGTDQNRLLSIWVSEGKGEPVKLGLILDPTPPRTGVGRTAVDAIRIEVAQEPGRVGQLSRVRIVPQSR